MSDVIIMTSQGECSSSNSSSRMQRLGGSDAAELGILNERILFLVFESMEWDIRTLCRAAAVNRRLRALANRLLWRELCLHRAGRMMSALTDAGGRVIGGWQAMAKLLFFCGGCEPVTRHFTLGRPEPGHFVESTRFSKTSGRSFLPRSCREDVLYVTDPCEHRGGDNNVGIYRGVFRSFTKSRTRACLIRRQVEFEDGMRCPYCGTRVWSMTTARLVPRRSAARRLGSSDDLGALEYFVCLNGHLHGMCWLVPLSSDENGEEDDRRLGDADDSSADDYD